MAKMNAHQRALKNLRARVKAAERATGLRVVLPDNLNLWTNRNLNNLTRRRLIREFAVQDVQTSAGMLEFQVSEIKRLNEAMKKANELAERYTGEPIYEGLESVTATSKVGLKKFLAGVRARGRKSWWDKRSATMVENFTNSTEWIYSMDPHAYDLIQDALGRMTTEEISRKLTNVINANRSLTLYFFASDDQEFQGTNAIYEIFDLLDIELPDTDVLYIGGMD